MPAMLKNRTPIAMHKICQENVSNQKCIVNDLISCGKWSGTRTSCLNN